MNAIMIGVFNCQTKEPTEKKWLNNITALVHCTTHTHIHSKIRTTESPIDTHIHRKKE